MSPNLVAYTQSENDGAMKRLSLYSGLALKDVLRLWSATQIQIVIISGICLPILILLGLKNGHVADLREELATSPTGRQVLFWSAQGGDLLSDSVLENIKGSIENTDLIIPESQRLVFGIPKPSATAEQNLTGSNESSGQDESSGQGESSAQGEQNKVAITLYSTLPGDPLLGQFGIETIDAKTREMVLSRSVADSLSVKPGDSFEVEISRRLGSDQESHRLSFVLKGILPANEQGGGQGSGYAHLDVMQLLERYGTGSAVDEWALPAMQGRTAVDLYESMLLFCFRGPHSDLSKNDREFLKSRGLTVREVEDPNVRSLFGALNENAQNELVVYMLERIDREQEGQTPIRDSPQLIVRNTEAEDDLIVRWCPPVKRKINGQEHLLVGLTLPTKRETGGWLNTFLREDAKRFTYEESVSDPFALVFPHERPERGEGPFSLAISSQISVVLTTPDSGEQQQQDAAPSAAAAGPPDSLPVAIVPVNLLAYLHQLDAGLVQFDPAGKRFVEIPSELDYTKARLYTHTIDDVPQAVDWLASQEFAVLSESSRIAEIHEQDRSLQTLVFVVAFGVFAFGVVTVFSVLVDSTDRKKGTIGILRVMGISRIGVFTMVLFRAFVIGLLAAGLCVCVGYGLAAFLRADTSQLGLLAWKPVISVVLSPTDISLIALGALLCASLGAVWPALRASALDPFDAITEGQFG